MLTLALITTVLSRLDHLGLDRLLLRTIALGKSSLDTKTVQLLRDQQQQTQQSVIDAINKGVLMQKDTQHIAFHHPMIQLVMRELFIKAPTALQQD